MRDACRSRRCPLLSHATAGLTPEQVDRLTAEHHIYLTRNGRIS